MFCCCLEEYEESILLMLLILPEWLVKPKLGLGADGMGWRRSPPGNEGDLGVCSGALLKEGVAGV